jgi:hypothetical protein
MTPSMGRHDCDRLDKALAKSWGASCGGHRGRSAVLLMKALTLPASRAPSTKPAARRRVSRAAPAGPVKLGASAWFLVGATLGSSSPLQEKLINQRCRDQRAPSHNVPAAESTHARRTAARSTHQQRSKGGAATTQRLERDEVPTSRRLGRRPLASRPVSETAFMGTLCHSWGCNGRARGTARRPRLQEGDRLHQTGPTGRTVAEKASASSVCSACQVLSAPPGHCLPALATTAKEEAIYPTRHPFFAAPRPVRRQVLTVVATRERLLGFEKPSGSGVVGGPSAHQGYLQ